MTRLSVTRLMGDGNVRSRAEPDDMGSVRRGFELPEVYACRQTVVSACRPPSARSCSPGLASEPMSYFRGKFSESRDGKVVFRRAVLVRLPPRTSASPPTSPPIQSRDATGSEHAGPRPRDRQCWVSAGGPGLASVVPGPVSLKEREAWLEENGSKQRAVGLRCPSLIW